MSKLRHPHLVQLHGIMLNPLRLVMEYCTYGDLYTLLTKKSTKYNLTWDVKCQLLLDVARYGSLEVFGSVELILTIGFAEE